MRLDGRAPDRIVCQKFAKTPFCLSRIAGPAAWNQISQPMLAKRPLVYGYDVIHDQLAGDTAIGAGTAKRVDNCVPLCGVELLVPKAAQNIAHEVVLRVSDCIALVASSGCTGCGALIKSIYIR